MGDEMTSFWTDIKLYEELLENDPDSFAFLPLSALYRKQGLFDEALTVARRGCVRHPHLAGAQLAVGLACYELGMAGECRDALEAVVRITPENLDAQRILSRMYADADDFAAAESALKIILALVPNDLESRVLRDTLSRPAGRMTASVDTEAGATSVSGSSESAADFLAGVFAGANGVPVSGELAAESGDDADDVDIIDLDDACIIEELDEMDAFDGEEPEEPADQTPIASVTMAELYVQQGFTDLAIAMYRQLLAANPVDTGILTRLDELLAAERAVQEVVNAQCEPLSAAAPGPVGQSPEPPDFGVAAGSAGAGDQAAVMALEGWLETIRRVKECRSSLH